MDRTKEEVAKDKEIYENLRNELLRRDLSNTENYDKSILTLSSAALGVSIASINSIIPLDTSREIWLLKLGWALLLTSTISSLAAYLISNKGISKQIGYAEKYYLDGDEEYFDKPNVYIKINHALNISTGLIFITGMISIVYFIIYNT
ncbi:hypothetical protein A9404_01985 [Halothiobacillus diazotrophicus]|uniref:DUF202 domain-containing protein n=1 Tax=Halothiobacillus diazotrophicus TaxID=1860122 RepID=A0A191ZEK7_9GAMM|nr:hypothetical protein [Halothiobacillus diazotrophicus]ANJ66311.1 hypothetical protein A9404_01985 [Halothiobacillus diazotrophicus]